MSRAASVLIACALAFAPAVAAQPAVKVYKIGYLTTGDVAPLRNALRQTGYAEDRNLVLHVRVSAGDPAELARLAGELVRADVDVIVAGYPAAAMAARTATTTIPIVMMNTPDPVQLGLVTSLAKPGGNVTGTTSLSVELSVKQLEIVKQVLPKVSRVAVFANPDNPWHPLAVRGLRDESRGLHVQFLDVRDPSQFDGAFKRITADRAEALVVLPDPMLHAPANRARLAALALRHRLPSIGGLRGWAQSGGMLSYWADEDALYRRAASYVDRILKGARAGDLPIEQPREFELVINRSTAKALGVAIPADVLVGATLVD